MATADWIQLGIAAIYAVILIVMFLQLRTMRASERETSAAMARVISSVEESAAATRLLAEHHASLAAQSELAAKSAAESSHAAAEANAIAVAAHRSAEERAQQDRSTAGLRIVNGLRDHRAALLNSYVRSEVGKRQSGANRTVVATLRFLHAIGASDLQLLGVEGVRTIRKLQEALRQAHVNVKKTDPDDPALAPVLRFAAEVTHKAIEGLEKLAVPEASTEDFTELENAARHKEVMETLG